MALPFAVTHVLSPYRRVSWIGWLGVVLLCAGGGAPAGEPVAFSVDEGGLRLRATFAAGEAIVDHGPGERRVSRIWGDHLGRTQPWEGSITIGDCLVSGREEGTYAFEAKTDAGLRGLGTLNAQSGTFAFWLRRSDLFERGGLLFSGRSYVAGGPRMGVHWALGIGGGRDSRAPQGHLFLTTTTIGAVQCVARELSPEGEWVHVAAVWDADMGAKLYWNGREVGANWHDPEQASVSGTLPGDEQSLLTRHGTWWFGLHHEVIPVPVDRIQLHRQRDGGAVADIHVFDIPLTAAEIARLARGEIHEPGDPLRGEAVSVNREKRLRWLGWGEGRDGDLIGLEPGRALTVREQWAERAYEDRRAAGFNAVDGIQMTVSPWRFHGYQHVEPRKLHLKFPERTSANYLIARGNVAGSLRAGGTRDDPFAGEEVLELPRSPTVFRRQLETAFEADSATFLHEPRRHFRQLSGLHFYRLEPGLPPGAVARTFHLHGPSGSEVPLGEWKRQEWVTSYGPGDRRFLVGQKESGIVLERRGLSALRAHHFFTPPMEEDFPLAGIGLRLRLGGMEESTRMQVRVHDGFDPWRELGRWDFLLEGAPGGEGDYELALMLRETLALRGEAVWVSVIFDRDAELLYQPGPTASVLHLFKAERERAERNFLEWELAGWRTAFEDMSEPRPWGRISLEEDSGWWLRASAPPYEHMVRVGRELMQRYPDDNRVRSWFAFLHPRHGRGENPARHIEPPEPGDHPRWAVLARANLALYAEFVDFWTRERAHENGEFGNWIGDDTCLLQDWPDLALIDDPGGRYRRVVRRLADGVVDGSYRDTGGREAFLANGLSTRWTDGLHAYEDGVNMQPMAFQLDYGNPVLFHRLLQTAARYDGFLLTPEKDGLRRFNSSGKGQPYWSTDRLPEGSPFHEHWHLATHPGLVLMWFNGSETVSAMFSELAEWLFRARDEGAPVDIVGAGRYLMLALWSRFGDERYLAELMDLDRAEGVMTPQPLYGPGSASADPSFIKRLPAGLMDNPAATVALSREDAHNRFAHLRTTRLGFGDRRFERNWFEWYLSRDKAYLEEGLVALYQKLKFLMPVMTVAEQSGDRVAIPKQLISQMYLGGVPAGRNQQFYPAYAVSYEGMGRDFAALVLDDTEDLLRVLFYNFEESSRRGLMRVWGLGPGEHEIIGGPDRRGDDRMDEVEHRKQREMVRGDGFAIEIPPQQLYLWEVRRQREGLPLWERPDLAVSAEEGQWAGDGSLTVKVHNIGATASERVPLELRDPDGSTVARRTVPALEAPLDLEPQTVSLRFTPAEVLAALGPNHTVIVVVDPGVTREEITRRNNRAVFVRPEGNR